MIAATRDGLSTPALVMDLPALERNIAAMAEWARTRGIAVRPHAKTHKSSEIARRQLAAGAVGICCAKLGEAEALAADGIGPLLITSPVVSAPASARLADLNRSSDGLMVVIDNPLNAAKLEQAVGSRPLDVLIDIDPGFHRTGVASAEAAVELAAMLSASPMLAYRGVQFYCGPHQHIGPFEERRAAVRQATSYLESVLSKLDAAGLPASIVTGGGTGTLGIDAELGILSEVQAGSYVFMDCEYLDCELTVLGLPRFEPALAIDTRVISANRRGQVTLDAGLKSMSTEAGAPRVLSGADVRSRFAFMGDEHGALFTPPGESDPALDQRITLLPPHCDPTVNLYDAYAVCEGEDVIASWPVTARGRTG